MSCLECKNASDCHAKIRSVMGGLKEGLKSLNHGYFMQGIEAIELAIIRLEQMDNEKNGRSVWDSSPK